MAANGATVPSESSVPQGATRTKRASLWFLRHRGLLDVLLTVTSVVAIGFTGLIIEDAFQLINGDNSRPGPVADVPRIIGCLTSIGLLLFLVWRRSRLAQAKGTLYYVRFLLEWMTDWHIHDEGRQRRGHLDERVISRHVPAAHGGVVDTAADITAIAAALQATMNDDDIRTGFTLAPNLLWPAAMGLGYQLHAWPGTTLVELSPTGPLEWSAGATPPRNSSFAVPERRIESAPAPEQAGIVWLTANLTSDGQSIAPPPGLCPDVRMRVAVWASDGALEDASEKVVVSTKVRPTADGRTVHPAEAREAVITAIRAALCRHPEATVYAVLRVPKTVALAIGQGLSGAGEQPHGDGCTGCVAFACRYPWRRLVLLLHDQDRPRSEGTQYLAMRVSAGQPSAQDIARQAQRHGLILSGARSDPSVTTVPDEITS